MSLKAKIRECISELMNAQNLDEERISNQEAAQKVKDRENFIGSHTYGEDLGGLNKMYVAYSYGEQHPLYMFYDGNWFQNTDDYMLDDGEVNIWTRKHAKYLKPSGEIKPRSSKWMKQTIQRFKKLNKIGENSHSDLEPGEK